MIDLGLFLFVISFRFHLIEGFHVLFKCTFYAVIDLFKARIKFLGLMFIQFMDLFLMQASRSQHDS